MILKIQNISTSRISFLEVSPSRLLHNRFLQVSKKYAYFAFNIKSDPTKEMVMKEYLEVGERNNPLEKYLEAVEVSTVAYFLSTKFNWIAEQKNITIKVNFLDDLT
jgi:hypothetical protein